MQSTTRQCHLVAGASSIDSNSSDLSAVICDDEEGADEPVKKNIPVVAKYSTSWGWSGGWGGVGGLMPH